MKLFERTEQQMFDEAVEHARKQKRKSEKVPEPGPYAFAYRSSDGSKCFIGALISDEDYRPGIEGMAADDLPVDIVGKPTDSQLMLAQALQNTHDRRAIELWEYSFADIANRFGLKYTPPQR